MDRLDWNLLRAFGATADTGSLSAAARHLGLTQPTLSRQIMALEKVLGATLFDRIGKRLVPTLTALTLMEHVRSMGEAADKLALSVAGQSADIAGTVRISATDAVAAYMLPTIVARIRAAAPMVSLAIVASNALSDLRRREADIAIRHVRPTEPELIGRLVCEMEARFYASTTWMKRNGPIAGPSDLNGAMLFGGDPPERFSAYLQDLGIHIPPEEFQVVSENSVVLWEMVRNGLGVGVMLKDIARRTDSIVDVLPDMASISVPVWLVTHRELRTSRRIRLVYDILADAIVPTDQRRQASG